MRSFLSTSLSITLLSSLKPLGKGFNLPISNLSTFDFRSVNSISLANSGVSMPVAPFKSDFVA